MRTIDTSPARLRAAAENVRRRGSPADRHLAALLLETIAARAESTRDDDAELRAPRKGDA